ncbi:hypothetical protein L6164_015719 [Bauhinia variegata]|uniref:Uncharacterized protein n=1 Tax=Bauhinia variegata TaxID=167791 RepID=A0ACB9NN89_BAUVA|nr:hypothetical protein L6164_015719 [Bauhinia variegata]
MGSGDCYEGMTSGNSEAKCSETTVEIKIKTLDSNTYTLRVDKCVPVPRLKEEVAIVTGVVSDRQRLICRGRVLKDDQLLSAYHVEDGHTLHLVVRQPIPSPSESFADHPAASISSNGSSQSFPIMEDNSDQDVGFLPDWTQFFSSFLNTFGMTIIGNDSSLEGLSRGIGSSDFRDSRREQSELGAEAVGSSSQNNNSSSVPSVPSQPPLLPDSLTTLTEYLSHLRREFSSTVRGQRSSDSAGSNASGEPHSNTAGPNGLPNAASLAAVLQSTRQLLVEQVAEFLLNLRRQMEDQRNGTGSLGQMSIQSNARRSGLLLHQVGALLLELGRVVMTLQMGQTGEDAVVNAGPALFISSSGPNPITVELENIQQRRNLGATFVGFGFPARNLDARIRTVGSVLPTGAPESAADMDSVVSGSASFTATATVSTNPLHRGSQSQIRPIRTVRVIRALPAQIRRPSNLSHNSVGSPNGSMRPPSTTENNTVESRRQTNPRNAEPRQSNVSSSSVPNAGIQNASSIQAEEHVTTGASSRHSPTPPSPNSKRQKRE